MNLVLAQISTLFSTISFIGLGCFTFKRTGYNKLSRYFLYFNVTVALWSLGFFLTMFDSVPYNISVLMSRFSHAIGAFSPVSFTLFALEFISPEVKGARKVILPNFVLYISRPA
jgi:hypothetical protein